MSVVKLVDDFGDTITFDGVSDYFEVTVVQDERELNFEFGGERASDALEALASFLPQPDTAEDTEAPTPASERRLEVHVHVH